MEETGGRATDWEVLTRNEENLNQKMPILTQFLCIHVFCVRKLYHDHHNAPRKWVKIIAFLAKPKAYL